MPGPRRARAFALIALTALVLAGAPGGAQDPPGLLPSELVLTGMTWLSSEDGVNQLVVSAARAQMQSGTELARLSAVHARMGSLAPGGAAGGGMSLRCEAGRFNLQSRDFEASGAVRGATADGRRFRTERLSYRAAEGRAFGEARVSLRDSTGAYEGDGFEYWVRENRFVLRNARVRQAPP